MRKKIVKKDEYDKLEPELQKLLKNGDTLEFLFKRYRISASKASVTFDGPDFLIEYIQHQTGGRAR